MSELFRKEAVSHAVRRLDGEVLLGTTFSWSVIGYGLAGVVFIGLLFASLATYARTEAVTGWLVPHSGIIRMTARDGGVLEAIPVHEGDPVKAGQPLARIRLSTDTSNGDSGQILEQSAKSQIEATHLGAKAQVDKLLSDKAQLLQQQTVLKAQRAEAAHFVDILTAKQNLAQANLARAQELKAKGYLSQQALDTANSSFLAAQQDVSTAKSNLLSLDQQMAQIASQIVATPILVAQANSQAKADQAALGQKLEQITAGNEYTLTSPIDGKVMALPLDIGQTVTAGNSVMVLVPRNSPLEAELFVPSRAAGFVKPGQDVSLQYQAFPYEKFGSGKGRVVSVSRTVLAPGDISLSGMSLQEPVFRVRVALDKDYVSAYGQKTPLQPGMLLNAAIVIDRRSLLEWLLDPIYAVSKRA